MSLESRNKPNQQDETLVRDLTTRLLAEGEGILKGQSKLVLTASILDHLNRQFKSVNRDSQDDITEDPSTSLVAASDSHAENVQYLYDFVKRVHALQVTNSNRTLQGSVNIAEFSGLRILELRRIPIHLFVGLQSLRTRLRTISCARCLQTLQDLFSTCGGDRSSPFAWPELISANLSFNSIEFLDNSLKFVPSLVYLDLSHNALTSTEALEFLTELEYLNLSFNQLESLPNICSRASTRLKVLSVRHNSIENLSKLSSLINLQQVDLAYNCIMEHSELNSLQSLQLLKLICLEGNPLFFQKDYRKLCLRYIHTPSLSFILDGKALTKGEVKMTKSRELQSQHQQQVPTNGWSARTYSADVSLQHVCTSPIGGESTSRPLVTNERSRIDGCLARVRNKPKRAPVTREVILIDGDDAGHPIDVDNSSDQLSRNTASVYRTDSLVAPRTENHRDGCDDAIVLSSSKSLETSREEEDDDVFRVRQEVAKCRQQLGSDWLTVGAQMHLFPGTQVAPSADPDQEFARMFGSGVVPPGGPIPHTSSPKVVVAAGAEEGRASNRASQVSDEVYVISTESEPPPPRSLKEAGEMLDQGCGGTLVAESAQIPASRASDDFLWNRLSSNDNDNESSESEEDLDDAGEEQTFIVDMEKPGSTDATNIILVVGKTELREKDSATGRTMERLDLKSICSVEILDNKNLRETGVKAEETAQIRVTFSYYRKDRRERIYTSVDSSSCQELLNCLKPIADENTFEEMALGALQCLKCSSQFSKEVAKKVIRKSNLQQPVLSRSADTSKGFLSEANACPNCGSEMVIELSDSSLPSGAKSPTASTTNAAATTRTATKSSLERHLTLSSPSRRNQSTPIPSSSSWNPVYTLGPTTTSTATAAKSLGDTDYVSACNGCTRVQVEAEVHAQANVRSSSCTEDDDDIWTPTPITSRFTTSGTEVPSSISSSLGRDCSATSSSSGVASAGLRRCESDITILSNPSQSSIQVMPTPSFTETTLDAISESSNDFNWMLHQQTTTTTDHVSTAGRSMQVISDSARRPLSFGSPSSGSNNGSLCTTVYQSAVVDSQRSETPESFLSAVSSSDEKMSPRRAMEAPLDGAQIGNSEVEVAQIVSDDDQRGDSASCTLDCDDSVEKDDSRLMNAATWSCRSATIKYSFQDFTQLDHRIQLYLIMHVLEPDEEIVGLLRAGIVPYNKSEESPGLLIIGRSKVYLLKITGQESDEPKDWLQKIGTYLCNALFYINVRLGNQCFQLEFGPKSAPNCFTVMLRDPDHCNNFISFLTEKINSGCLSVPESQVQFILDSDESLQTIREMLLLPCRTNQVSDDHSESEDEAEIQIRLYTMCYWIPQGQLSFEPISLVMTSTDLHVFTENLHWPLPHLIVPSTEILSQSQLSPRDKHKIQDLTAVEQAKDQFLELVLKFWDEDTAEESAWHIAMETKRSLQDFVKALKDPWERMFGVDLQISVSS